MRIAFISYEHPLGITGGGIGTYLGQISRVMAERGHEVEVFTGHKELSGTVGHLGYTVHRIIATELADFRERVLEPFAQVHTMRPFDIIESAEYGADALAVKKCFPDIPLTVKLHTPSFLVSRLNGKPFKSQISKFIFLLKCLRRGIVQKPFWVYDKKTDCEFELFRMADSLSSPSRSMKQIVEEEWGKDRDIEVVPLPFTPSDSLLNIPTVETNKARPVICFIGKLEARKGLLILMEAIPAIVEQLPNALFRFIGEPLPSPVNGLNMRDYLLKQLPSYASNLEFRGRQPAETIPALLEDVQVCVFPSLWENFPNVCLEAMAAGKVVVGTDNGGMADMITSGKNGFLIPPRSPSAISNVLVDLFKGKHDLRKIGSAARERILSEYNRERIGQLTEDFYERTIHRKLRLTRPTAGQIGTL